MVMTLWVRAIPILALVGLLPCTALSGQNTGTVTAVNINRVWNGLAVQLNVPITATYESACPWNNWIYLPQSDPFYASVLAALLAAKASGETVVVASGGCVQSPFGLLPVIATVDYGIRVGP
jgi:hypothetical protein